MRDCSRCPSWRSQVWSALWPALWSHVVGTIHSLSGASTGQCMIARFSQSLAYNCTFSKVASKACDAAWAFIRIGSWCSLLLELARWMWRLACRRCPWRCLEWRVGCYAQRRLIRTCVFQFTFEVTFSFFLAVWNCGLLAFASSLLAKSSWFLSFQALA